MRLVPFFPIAWFASACCKGSDNPWGAPNASAGSTPAATGTAKGDDRLVDVDLKPLALKIRVPAGGMGAMDLSICDQKSVTVDIGGGSSLNISEVRGDFASGKKTHKADTILFPFKKWVREEPILAIEQFENDGKIGYIGIAFKEIGARSTCARPPG